MITLWKYLQYRNNFNISIVDFHEINKNLCRCLRCVNSVAGNVFRGPNIFAFHLDFHFKLKLQRNHEQRTISSVSIPSSIHALRSIRFANRLIIILSFQFGHTHWPYANRIGCGDSFAYLDKSPSNAIRCCPRVYNTRPWYLEPKRTATAIIQSTIKIDVGKQMRYNVMFLMCFCLTILCCGFYT